MVCGLKGSGVWESGCADECKYEKGSQNMDQPKNVEEKSLRRASPLTYTFYQFLNTIQSLSNHPGSRTILFAIAVSGADAICTVADTACACVSDAVLNY